MPTSLPPPSSAPPAAPFVEIKKTVGRGAGRGDILEQLDELNAFQRQFAPQVRPVDDDFVRKVVGRPRSG